MIKKKRELGTPINYLEKKAESISCTLHKDKL